MKNILEYFLGVLNVDYTKYFVRKLYQEHPHKNNMYGLKRMLDVYGVKSLGVRIDTLDPSKLNYPCIIHTYGEFVIGIDCSADTITYLHQGRKATITHDTFRRLWTGNALVVEATTNAIEPNFQQNLWEALILKIKTYSIPLMLVLIIVSSITSRFSEISNIDAARIVLSSIGIGICSMLIEKQLFGKSHYGDRVCSLFHHADCNSILDGDMAKIFGISWSEVGLGYFTANLLLLSVYPASSFCVAIINWIAMCYGIWSIYYQRFIAKAWCTLCVITQIIIWAIGIITVVQHSAIPFEPDLFTSLATVIVFTISILVVHRYSTAYLIDEERTRAIQQYYAIKSNKSVARLLIKEGEYYKTTPDDSAIIFGNPEAKIRVTILSNPHCNPCARMHQQVEQLLGLSGDGICIQYIFSAFNEGLEDSCRYLISCYLCNSTSEALSHFSSWYTKDKFNYKEVIKKEEASLHSKRIEEEMDKHKAWRKRTSLNATPTVLVNGYKLPNEYELIDLSMIVDNILNEEFVL